MVSVSGSKFPAHIMAAPARAATQLPDDLSGLTTAQIAAIGSADISKLSTAQITSLASNQIAALTTAQIAALTSGQIQYLMTQQVGALRSSQIAALSTLDIRTLAAQQLSALSSDQIHALNTIQISALSSIQAVNLTIKQIAGFDSGQISALRPDALAVLATDVVAGFNTSQISGLTNAEIVALTSAQIQALGGKISALSTGQITALENSDFALIGTAGIRALTSDQLASLTSKQLGYFATSQIAALTSGQVASLTSRQLATLGLDQFKALGGQIANLTTSQLTSLNSVEIAALTTGQIRALGTKISALTASQIGFIGNQGIAGLTGNQIQSLTTQQIIGLTTTQFQALGNNQIAAMTTSQIAAIETRDLAALSMTVSEAQIKAKLEPKIFDLNIPGASTDTYAPVLGMSVDGLYAWGTFIAHDPSNIYGRTTRAYITNTATSELVDLTPQGSKAAYIDGSTPDGAYIWGHYQSQNELNHAFIVKTNGTGFTAIPPVPNTRSTIDGLSKDGKKFIGTYYDNANRGHFFSVSTDGTGMVDFTPTDMNYSGYGGISDDGSKVWADFYTPDNKWHSYIFSPDGKKKIDLTLNSINFSRIEGMSPDGSKAWGIFTGSDPNAHTFIMNSDGSNFVDTSQYLLVQATTANGSKIFGSKPSYNDSSGFLMNPDGSGAIFLNSILEGNHSSIVGFSQKEKLIWGNYYKSGSGAITAFAMNFDGSNVINLTPTGAFSSTITGSSPDGKLIWGEYATKDNIQHLFISHPDGSNFTDITPAYENEYYSKIIGVFSQNNIIVGNYLVSNGQGWKNFIQTLDRPGLQTVNLPDSTWSELNAVSSNGLATGIAMTPTGPKGFVIDLNKAVPQVASFTSAQMAALSVGQLAAFSADQLSTFTTTQIASLTTAQIASLSTTKITALTADQIQALTSSQIAALTTKQLQLFNPSKIATLTTSQIPGLTTLQISKLGIDQVRALGTNDMAVLTSAQIAAISTQNIVSGALSAQQIRAMGRNVAALTTSQIAILQTVFTTALTSQQIQSLRTDQIAALKSGQIQALNSSQIMALTTDQIAALTTGQIRFLKLDQVASIETMDLASLTTGQLVALSESQIASLTNDQITAFTTGQISVLTGGQISSLTADQIQAVQTIDFIQLSTGQIKALRADQIAALSTGQIKALTTTQITALDGKQIQALTATDIATLNTAQLSILATAQIASLTTAQIDQLSSRQLSALSTMQTAALTSDQIAVLTKAEDVAALQMPVTGILQKLTVSDTMANISKVLDQLQIKAKAGVLTSIKVTDGDTTGFHVTASSAKAHSDLFNLVQSNNLFVTGVAAADVNALLAIKSTTSLDIVDSWKNLSAKMADIQAAISNSKIQSVTLTDKTALSLSVADAYTLTQTLPNLTMGANVKINIKDTASTIIAHARYDVGDVLKNAGTVSISDKAPITIADAIQLKGLTNLDSATKYTIADSAEAIAAQKAISGDKIVSGAASVTAATFFTLAEAKGSTGIAALAKGSAYAISDTASNILAQSADATDTILSGAKVVTIADTSANIIANIDRLQVLAKAGKFADIRLTDTPSEPLDLSQDQLVKDAEVIGKIVSPRDLPGLNQIVLNTPIMAGYKLNILNLPRGAYPLYGLTSKDGNTFAYYNYPSNDQLIYKNGDSIDLKNYTNKNYHITSISGDGSTIAGTIEVNGRPKSFVYKNNSYMEIEDTTITAISEDGNMFIGVDVSSGITRGTIGELGETGVSSKMKFDNKIPKIMSSDAKTIVFTEGTSDAGEISLFNVDTNSFIDTGIHAIPKALSRDKSILIGAADDGSHTYSNGFVYQINSKTLKNNISNFVPYGLSQDGTIVYGQSGQHGAIYQNNNFKIISFNDQISVAYSSNLMSLSGDRIALTCMKGLSYVPAIFKDNNLMQLTTTRDYNFGGITNISSDGKKILGFINKINGEIEAVSWDLQS